MSDQLVPEVPGRSRAEMERLAEDFVRVWAPERLSEPGPFPVFDVFESLPEKNPGLVTGAEDLPDGVEGICWPDGRVFISGQTYEQLVAGFGRARFTTVHEICHALYHRRHITRALVETGRLPLFRRSTVPAYRDPEWQANAFASAVLMPARAAAIEVTRCRVLSAEHAIQHAFGVSYQAAKIRVEVLRKCGAI